MELLQAAATAAVQALSVALASIDSASDYGALMALIALAHVGAIWFRGMMRKR